MDKSVISQALSDQKCGLFFLAGLDAGKADGVSGVVTVHVAEGTVSDDQLRTISDRLSAIDPGLDVHILSHSPRGLYAPDSLETFSSLFVHEQIVADPTGAFTRGSELLALARTLRAELGGSVDRILWRNEDSSLVVVAAPSATWMSPAGRLSAREEWSDDVKALVARSVGPDLARVIRCVRVEAVAPSGRYVPIDRRSVVAPVARRKAAGLLARVAGIAAMVGISTVAAAASVGGAQVVDADGQVQTPGITALAGLTTLGENSVGHRNHYQAIGGLRLYFGETDLFLASAASSAIRGIYGAPGEHHWPPNRLLDVSG